MANDDENKLKRSLDQNKKENTQERNYENRTRLAISGKENLQQSEPFQWKYIKIPSDVVNFNSGNSSQSSVNSQTVNQLNHTFTSNTFSNNHNERENIVAHPELRRNDYDFENKPIYPTQSFLCCDSRTTCKNGNLVGKTGYSSVPCSELLPRSNKIALTRLDSECEECKRNFSTFCPPQSSIFHNIPPTTTSNCERCNLANKEGEISTFCQLNMMASKNEGNESCKSRQQIMKTRIEAATSDPCQTPLEVASRLKNPSSYSLKNLKGKSRSLQSDSDNFTEMACICHENECDQALVDGLWCYHHSRENVAVNLNAESHINRTHNEIENFRELAPFTPANPRCEHRKNPSSSTMPRIGKFSSGRQPSRHSNGLMSRRERAYEEREVPAPTFPSFEGQEPRALRARAQNASFRSSNSKSGAEAYPNEDALLLLALSSPKRSTGVHSDPVHFTRNIPDREENSVRQLHGDAGIPRGETAGRKTSNISQGDPKYFNNLKQGGKSQEMAKGKLQWDYYEKKNSNPFFRTTLVSFLLRRRTPIIHRYEINLFLSSRVVLLKINEVIMQEFSPQLSVCVGLQNWEHWQMTIYLKD